MYAYDRVLVLDDLPVAVRAGATSLEDLPTGLRHLSFDRVVGLLGEAWVAFLRSCGEKLEPQRFGVVHLGCQYLREVKPGPLRVAVDVERLGTTSVTLALEIQQDGAPAARASLVLAHKDFVAVRAVPLLAEQRRVLTVHLANEATPPRVPFPPGGQGGPGSASTRRPEEGPMSGLDNSQPVTDAASLHEGHLDEEAQAMHDTQVEHDQSPPAPEEKPAPA